jgi:hypothetical protein
MRKNRREGAVRGAIALLAVGCLSACATLPHTAQHSLEAPQALAYGPPAPPDAVDNASPTNGPESAVRWLPALKKTGDVLLQLILPIPSAQVPSWASQMQSDCFAHVLSQWCTQFHLQ